MRIVTFIILVLQLANSLNMDSKTLSSSIAKFSAKFCNELDKTTSIVSSPLSAEFVLALLTLGTTDPAHEELITALAIPDDNSIRSSFSLISTKLNSIKGVTLNVANKVYIKEGGYELAPELAKDAVKVFNAGLEKINFSDGAAAADRINKWVESKTNKKIKDLLSPDSLNDDTRLVLVNALYFKGSWKKKFDPNNTSDQPFFVSADTQVDVPMMYKEDDYKYGVSEELRAQLLEIPYEGEAASMFIVLPDDVTGLDRVLQKLAEGYDLISEMDKMHKTKVQVTIPKFKIETEIDLKTVLPKLGINAIFDSRNSGLTKILNNEENLYVSKAVQKAFIEVNEEGAEAAAATEPDDIITKNKKMFALINKGWETNGLKYNSQMSSFELTTLAHDFNPTLSWNPKISAITYTPHVNLKLKKIFPVLEKFEQKLHKITFNKLVSISPKEQHENGISFVQSGLLLCLVLLVLSTEVDEAAKFEIKSAIGFHTQEIDFLTTIKELTDFLPTSDESFKFHWASRLVLKDNIQIKRKFFDAAANISKLRISHIRKDNMENVRNQLNDMIFVDSGGSLHETFDDDELTYGICAVLLNTMYIRPTWRSPPTVLNGTLPFNDGDSSRKSTSMIRINDVMGYVDLKDWDAEALEIQYSTPHLSLLILLPRGNSLRRLLNQIQFSNSTEITGFMTQMRIAATIPLYTLRMTLLLQNKLEQMGITKLFIDKESQSLNCEKLELSHAIQRLMFWSEAGRNAYKDDGIEWDEPPQMEILVNRPYLFYVRWKDITLMSGNFVL